MQDKAMHQESVLEWLFYPQTHSQKLIRIKGMDCAEQEYAIYSKLQVLPPMKRAFCNWNYLFHVTYEKIHWLSPMKRAFRKGNCQLHAIYEKLRALSPMNQAKSWVTIDRLFHISHADQIMYTKRGLLWVTNAWSIRIFAWAAHAAACRTSKQLLWQWWCESCVHVTACIKNHN